LIFILYGLASLLLLWFVFTFLYQYVAALGSWQAVIASFGSERILTALGLSVLSSFATVAVALVFGIPLAYVLAVKEFKGKSFLETMAVDVPQTFPPLPRV